MGKGDVSGRLNHPRTQEKIERYTRSMKNAVKRENYCLLGDFENRIAEFIECFNNYWHHDSLDNLTPSDVYFGRDREILQKRVNIKIETMKKRRKQYLEEVLDLLKFDYS